jgi:cell division septum initiation protein DivIVA
VSVSEVSAFEPQPLAEPKLDMPEFQVVRRGLDRRQVEEWGGKLTSLVEQERRRADRAEQALYRLQVEAKDTPSFSHLGAHVADIIEEAGRSAEKMLLDAAERAQEAIDAAGAEATKITTEAEEQAGEIERAVRQDAEQLRAEGAQAAEEIRQAAEAFRDQTEQEAHKLLREAREATDQLWKETERECSVVEAETRRLEELRQRTQEQLGRVYGHLESVLDEIRLGIDDAQAGDEQAAVGEPAVRRSADPSTGSRQAGPVTPEASLPGMAESKPAAGMRSEV